MNNKLKKRELYSVSTNYRCLLLYVADICVTIFPIWKNRRKSNCIYLINCLDGGYGYIIQFCLVILWQSMCFIIFTKYQSQWFCECAKRYKPTASIKGVYFLDRIYNVSLLDSRFCGVDRRTTMSFWY